MAIVRYAEVIKLVEQLSSEEQTLLMAHLEELSRYRELTKDERIELFNAMTIDLGSISPDYSDRRADWYGDDER